MADVIVTLAFTAEQAATGTSTVGGSVEFRPTVRRTVGSDVVLPSPFTVALTPGAASPTVTLTQDDGSTWAWEALERISEGRSGWTAFTLSDVAGGTANYCDLTLVDADTLTPVASAPTTVQDSLDALALTSVDMLVVESAADLTAYLSGDEYVLPAKLVMVNGTVDLVDKAVRLSTGTVLRGLSNGTLVSTNASGVVRATNLAGPVVIRELNVVAPAGECFTLTGGITHQLNLFFCGMFGAKAATISGFNVQAIKQCYIESADGITFAGTTNKVFVSESPFYGITGSAIKLASTLAVNVIDIVTSFFKFNSPGVGVTAEAGYSVGQAKLRGSLIDGTAVPLAGLSAADPNWTMTDNTGIADSRIVGGLHLAASAVTTITAPSTPVKVAGTTTGLELNERYTATNNRLTYTGLQPTVTNFSGTFAVDSGNNVLLNFYLAKNGAVLPETIAPLRIGTGTDERLGFMTGIVAMVPGDYVEIWAENVSGTASLTCLSLNLNGIG